MDGVRLSMALLVYLFRSPCDTFPMEDVGWMSLPEMEYYACVSGLPRSQPKIAEKNLSSNDCDVYVA